MCYLLYFHAVLWLWFTNKANFKKKKKSKPDMLMIFPWHIFPWHKKQSTIDLGTIAGNHLLLLAAWKQTEKAQ